MSDLVLPVYNYDYPIYQFNDNDTYESVGFFPNKKMVPSMLIYTYDDIEKTIHNKYKPIISELHNHIGATLDKACIYGWYSKTHAQKHGSFIMTGIDNKKYVLTYTSTDWVPVYHSYDDLEFIGYFIPRTADGLKLSDGITYSTSDNRYIFDNSLNARISGKYERLVIINEHTCKFIKNENTSHNEYIRQIKPMMSIPITIQKYRYGK